jgi:hypothetical protein
VQDHRAAGCGCGIGLPNDGPVCEARTPVRLPTGGQVRVRNGGLPGPGTRSRGPLDHGAGCGCMARPLLECRWIVSWRG